MKLIRENSNLLFDPKNIISNYNILGKADRATGRKAYTEDGLFSPTIFGNIDINEEIYSCECGAMKGKFYEGCTCPQCHTEVKFLDRSIDRMGWIDISGNKYDDNGNVIEEGKGYKIIKYIEYTFLEKLFGSQLMSMIWKTPDAIDEYGEIDFDEVERIRNESPQSKYYYIGLKEFYDNYDEVIKYYYDLFDIENKPDKLVLYDAIRFKENVFTDKIPVISSMLRPAKRDGDALKLDEINNNYLNLVKLSYNINNMDIDIPILTSIRLTMLQGEYFNLVSYVISVLSGKKGLIRNNLSGTRINFSARNIITPAFVGRKVDEIVLPYQTFLELYKYEIVNILKKIKQCTYREALNIHENAKLKFNQEVYDIMKKMIKDSELGVLLNRNPTINYGSILYLRVCDVKKDIEDFTMSINNIYTEALAADYDGDVLNLISIKDKRIREKFKEIFSPKSMIISAKNGHFNKSFSLKKDQLLGLNMLLQ